MAGGSSSAARHYQHDGQVRTARTRDQNFPSAIDDFDPLPVVPIELFARFLAACALAELAEAPRVPKGEDGARDRIGRLRSSDRGSRRA